MVFFLHKNFKKIRGVVEGFGGFEEIEGFEGEGGVWERRRI